MSKSSKAVQSIRGMNDFAPEQTRLWRPVEKTLIEVLDRYGYSEVRFPIIERTELFKRSIGEVTDIVEKEMYTFPNRGGDQLMTLRPEGTAGCVRAGVQNGWLYNQIRKLWYVGPMFRYERPQAGRYRQFHQLGVEVFGLAKPGIDAEVLLMSARFWKDLGLDGLTLNLNSLGTLEERQQYREVLIEYFSAHQDQLDEEAQRRLLSNPMRILDSKNPVMQDLNNAAPQLSEYLQAESADHFAEVCERLDAAGVGYVLNPRLVRGLDYYTRTVFEWTTTALGAQDAVCSGGRYDGLVAELGGQATPAVGFAIGLERLLALLEQQQASALQGLPVGDADVYFLSTPLASQDAYTLQKLAEQVRDRLDLRVVVDHNGGKLAKQMKRADASGAQVAVILGASEAEQQAVTVKPLRDTESSSAGAAGLSQQTIAQSELVTCLQQLG